MKRRAPPVPITSLVHAHVGQPAVVMGGGPSLPWYFVPELSPVWPPADAVLISANAHGCRLAAAGFCRRPDYLVCVDEVETMVRTNAATGEPWGVPVITRRPWGDIELFRKPVHGSGQVGALVAWILGCSPILLLGMDLYAEGVYYDAPAAVSTGTWLTPGEHLQAWAALIGYRAASGEDVPPAAPGGAFRVPPGAALARLFPAWDPGEPAPAPADAAVILDRTQGEHVRFVRAHPHAGGHYQPNEVAELRALEARKLVRRRVAVPA